MSHGLWYFPPPGPPTPRAPPDPEKVREAKEKRAQIRADGFQRSQALLSNLRCDGTPKIDVFEQQAWDALATRLKAQTNRCERCWHDRKQRCICDAVRNVSLDLPVRVLVLMHYKEYYRASDDAKLLMMMLPPSAARLLIFGRPGDLAALDAELDEDPAHSLLLWPGEGAQTVEQFVAGLPPTSAWKASARRGDTSAVATASTADASASAADADASGARPLLRVVVLDAVYRHARTMFRHLQRTRCSPPLQHVALHPKTLSVYSRAQHGYAQASAASVAQSSDPAALRICTVEAYALLLSELGEANAHTRAFVDAVVVNNDALRMAGAGGVR